MQLRVLGSSGGACRDCYTMSALVDGHILIDAGTGVQKLSLAEMAAIDHVLLTHCHLDHTAMLCLLSDCRIGEAPLTVHCLQETADAIRHAFFKDSVWIDLEKTLVDDQPIARFNIIQPYQTLQVDGARFTPLPVVHAVPTVAYCLHGQRENFVYAVDMAHAEDRFWRYLEELENFHRMSIEVSFPNHLSSLAHDSYHLTPALLASCIQRVPAGVKLYYCHTKPQFTEQIARQLHDLFGDRVVSLEQEQIFSL